MRRKREKLAPFVPLLKETLATPAWKAMSHGARSLYVALKLRYSSNFKNNGKLYLSQRDAIKEIGSGFEEIGNWFRELQHYGFAVMTQPGHLGVDGEGLAPHWRLTELGYLNDPPTRDFMKWDGTKFVRHQPRRKQNPATESRSTPLRKAVAPPLRKAVALQAETATESRSIQGHPPATESRSITSLTTCGAELGGTDRGKPTLVVAGGPPPPDDLDIPGFLRRAAR
jgi:hypothetical protein